MKFEHLKERLSIIIDRYYIIVMMVIAFIITWLNYYGSEMLVVYAYYIDFKNIILSGLNPDASIIGTPTFPMWGYGFLLLLTENKIVLIFIQFTLALFSIWFIIRIIEKRSIFNVLWIRILKTLLIFCIPWYTFHSIRWPYSMSISLISLSVFLMIDTLFYSNLSTKKTLLKISLAAVLFGLALNFRSDYYFIPFLMAGVIILYKRMSPISIAYSVVWVTVILVMLIPWGIYTKKTTGHYLFTSTNSGHVFYIGLGNLPNNKWGIIPNDHDPSLAKLILDNYHEPKSTLLYETDSLVKKEFLNKISLYPKEYFKKCIYSFYKMSISGVYPGEFWLEEHMKIQPLSAWIQPGDTWKRENGDFERRKFLKKSFAEAPFKIFTVIKPLELARIIAKKITLYLGKLIVFLSFLMIPLTVFISLKRKNYFIIFPLLIILYQIAINVFAYNWYLYTSNILFFLMLNLIYGASLFRDFIPNKYLKQSN